MAQLNITSNITALLQNERILFLLTCTKRKYIEVEGKKYSRRSRSFQIVEHLLDANQTFQEWRIKNEDQQVQILNKYFEVIKEVAKYVYGITDEELIKRNYDYMQPILDGELYRVMNDYYNTWNIEPIIDNLNSIIHKTKQT